MVSTQGNLNRICYLGIFSVVMVLMMAMLGGCDKSDDIQQTQEVTSEDTSPGIDGPGVEPLPPDSDDTEKDDSSDDSDEETVSITPMSQPSPASIPPKSERTDERHCLNKEARLAQSPPRPWCYDAELTSFDGTKITMTIYVPVTAEGKKATAPLILYSHGFGGSRNKNLESTEYSLHSEASLKAWYAGYWVITFDERGFGESGDAVRLMSPDKEGKDITAVIDWAENNEAIQPHLAYKNDNLILGSVGWSYGGGFQTIGSSVDGQAKSRFDAIVPIITWNDLRYSLYNNNVPKGTWINFLAGLGESGSKGRMDDRIRQALLDSKVPPRRVSESFQEALYKSSPKSFCDAKTIPKVDAFFIQGVRDTLFDFNESYDNAQCYQKAGNDVRFLAQTEGHMIPAYQPSYSGATGATVDETVKCGASTYETADLILAWFDEKLKAQEGKADHIPKVCLIPSIGNETPLRGVTLDHLDYIPVNGPSFDIPETDVNATNVSETPAFAPLMTAQTTQLLAGIPKVDLKITNTAGDDPIFFVGIGIKRAGSASVELVHTQVTPVREATAYKGRLVGISTQLNIGDQVGLAFYAEHAVYGTATATVPIALKVNGTVQLPLLDISGDRSTSSGASIPALENRSTERRCHDKEARLAESPPRPWCYDTEITSFDGTKITATVYVPVNGKGEKVKGPLILYSHGFGGSRNTNLESSQYAVTAESALKAWYAGYWVITFDERGFGDSEGTVQVMSPDYEGKDISAVITWAEKNPDIRPFLEYRNDNLVLGSVGLSYGGGFQTIGSSVDAAIDKRFDAIVPIITWNDLRVSLNRNNVPKGSWIKILFGLGESGSKGRMDNDIRTALAQSQSPPKKVDDEMKTLLYQNSPQSFCDKNTQAKVDAFFIQGVRDTLFDFNEAYANARCYEAGGKDVRFLLQTEGHILPIEQASYSGNESDPENIGMHIDKMVQCGSSLKWETADLIFRWFEEKLRGVQGATKVIPPVCLIPSIGSEAPLQGITLSKLSDIPKGGISLTVPETQVDLTNRNKAVLDTPQFVPLQTADKTQILAGIPMADLTLTPGDVSVDPIIFMGVGIQRNGQDQVELVNFQVTPIRETQTYRGEMVGVSTQVNSGDQIGLLFYASHPVYEGNSSETMTTFKVKGTVSFPFHP